MSLLLYEQREDCVEILTDTLVTTADGITPSAYHRKVWEYPHLNLVMVVTGTANVGSELHLVIDGLDDASDIDDLDAIAPDVLRAIEARLVEQFGDIGASTVHLFGFPRESKELVSYAYTSQDGARFASSRFVGGKLSVGPPPVAFTPRVPETPAEKVALACLLRQEQDEMLGAGLEAVRIGGEIVATLVERDNIRTVTWYRFADYDELLQQTTSRIAR